MGKTVTHSSRNWPSDQFTLWPRVLFVDWHGVLSKAPLWHSIRANFRHPFRARLEPKTAELFGTQWQTVEAWMRGRHTTEEIVNLLAIEQPQSANNDYFIRKLYHDCRTMPLHKPLIEALHSLSASWNVVIATDNMDCLVTMARQRRDIRSFSDDLISSSDVGVLKAESPVQFFGAWLEIHGLTFSDAVLLDDGRENCRAFEQAGGTSRYVRSPDEAAHAVRDLLATVS
jgi:FMN phosphatase YigB (HAD superfamily)